MTATMIKFVCGTCGERLSVPERFAGRKGACPGCGAVNRVPLRGFAETATPPARAATSERTTTAARVNGNGTAVARVHGGTATVVAPSAPAHRGPIEPAVKPVEAPPSRVRTLLDPPPPVAPPVAPPKKRSAPAPQPEPMAPVNGNGHGNGNPYAYVHPLVEAVAAPPSDLADPLFIPAPPVVLTEADGAAPRNHGVLAADELTPGERWKRAWEEPRQGGLARKVLGAILSRGATEETATRTTARARTLDDGFSLPAKIGMLLGAVTGLVGMIYLVLYFLLWSHLNMNP